MTDSLEASAGDRWDPRPHASPDDTDDRPAKSACAEQPAESDAREGPRAQAAWGPARLQEVQGRSISEIKKLQ